MEFLLSCSIRHLTRSLCSFLSYRFEHSKRNCISTRAHVLFSIYHIDCGVLQGFLALKKAVAAHVKKHRIFSRVLIFNQLHTQTQSFLDQLFVGAFQNYGGEKTKNSASLTESEVQTFLEDKENQYNKRKTETYVFSDFGVGISFGWE